MDQIPPTNLSDHDIIVILYTEMKNIKLAIKDIQDVTLKVQNDHENRLRIIEKSQDILFGKILGASAVVSVIVVIIAAIIQGVLR